MLLKIPNNYELYAFCVNATPEDDGENDFVHVLHLYKVKEFTEEPNFFPCGVRVIDKYNNELNQTFRMRRFLYMHHYLN